jgi:hypothetical protein
VQVQDIASGRVLGAHSVRGSDIFPLADDLRSPAGCKDHGGSQTIVIAMIGKLLEPD